MAQRRRLGLLPSFFLLTSSCTLLAYHALKLRYELPEPLVDLINKQTGRPQISERAILEDAAYLSESIGYRTVGTREHADGDQWMLSQATRLKEACDSIVQSDPIRHLECEVFRQEGSGAHRFDMMDRRVYKNYVNLSNIIFRISNGTLAGKEHALLVNSHLDSTLPSPGAADDALPAALMLDCIRVLINTPDWTPHYALVFLWNNAEESLQDGSHLFSTQGDLGSTVRAVINLEAAGTSGPELLFQATSEEMIEAYSHVPRPFGTVVANDVFRSGIILSDTDFRQFQEYRNLTGLDMAIVGDSYLYHTRKDLVANIEKGVAQHMGENVLALLEYLSSSDSPIPRLESYSSPQVAYLSFGGRYFLIWSFKTAQRMYNSVLVVSALILFGLAPSGIGLRNYSAAAFGVLGGLVGAVVGANVVALIMTRVLHAGLSWFAVKWTPLVLYGVPALVGILIVQYGSARLSSPRDAHLEYGTFVALHLVFATSSVVLQYLGIASAAAGFCWAVSSFAALLLQFTLSIGKSAEDITLPAYLIAQLIPSAFGMELAATFMDIFVPLTGRMGNEAPAEHIIATMVAVMTFLVMPFSIPFVHRFSRKTLLVSILVLTALSAVLIGVFSSSWLQVFDELHPRRLFVLHQEDITTGEYSLHVGLADSAPGVPALIRDIEAVFGSKADGFESRPVVMDDWNKDWDVLYPFTQFIEPYKIRLDPPSSDYVSPWTSSSAFRVTAAKDVWDAIGGTRELSLVIDHPEIIWSVIAFDAHVLSWQLDKNPLPYFARHHIKEASFYGVDRWTLDLVINATTKGERPILNVDFQGIQEKGMWPAKKAERQGPAMDLFEQLDAWLDERPAVTFDALLLGCVSGVAII